MSFCANLLLQALRQKLKEKNVTYSELSERINVPVSTLKRHFHSQSISLDKLLEYASILDTNLEELVRLAGEIHTDTLDLSGEKRDELFFEYPFLYDFFNEIRVKGKPVEQVKQENQLSDQSVYVYLRALEVMGLIEIKPHNSGINYLTPPYYSFHEGSKLDQLFTSKLKQDVFTNCHIPQLGLCRVTLTNEQTKQLADLLYEKIQQFHFQNNKLKNREALRKNLLFAVTEGNGFWLSEGIKEIEPAFLKTLSTRIG
ncbi:helix-turn-helix transcriptional regulator [Vibrio metschnikovii]|uniref:Helix-turn-helix domain-containing protein n=4 Tax=Bacteria TaxID=2 RepID=A0AAU6T1D4_UNCXX|nr:MULTISPECIES: helix-turn-helix transcriptional regulator [Vibrio]EEX36458.1 hypothetical protein VIB_002773 [Vibrio metschnikovii CIP 69.14]EKO3556830.1 helix-turn-helix transcriptional regulator [Vibrio metschnikovii]EKO3569007.1 helix-turn-helix transcriptional regulator [Vibrio metschnikovii]EKO3573399.1 helix-turn-helix transcriptional regulator [Vibrio metschnikovii]EKO3576141.1 helix-turn-helix transcriptional regulator [Vibrio metschnikovii]